ncbi:hypothetical protein FXO38_08478 [Capsicum annuum]|nr:hypothetical protein FXO38_08478 [Capsicum annuum]
MMAPLIVSSSADMIDVVNQALNKADPTYAKTLGFPLNTGVYTQLLLSYPSSLSIETSNNVSPTINFRNSTNLSVSTIATESPTNLLVGDGTDNSPDVGCRIKISQHHHLKPGLPSTTIKRNLEFGPPQLPPPCMVGCNLKDSAEYKSRKHNIAEHNKGFELNEHGYSILPTSEL